MTPAQKDTVARLKAEGFELIVEAGVVRVTRGADRRIIFEDGSQKRGHHVDLRQGNTKSKRMR
jgi:hypothetical protein